MNRTPEAQAVLDGVRDLLPTFRERSPLGRNRRPHVHHAGSVVLGRALQVVDE